MLYIFDEIEKLDGGYLRRSIPYLSQERKNKVFSYRFSLDQKLSAAAYMLLRFAMEDRFGIDKPLEFSYGKYGKPYLRDYPQIYFNLSHCAGAIACAVSDDEVGVDVQGIEPVPDGVAKRALTAKEYAAYKEAGHPPEMFCKCWTIKESHLKRTGQGIIEKLTELSAEDITEKSVFKAGKGYFCCVAGISEGVQIVGGNDICIR